MLHFFYVVVYYVYFLDYYKLLGVAAEGCHSRARWQLRLLEWLQNLGPFQQTEERDREDEGFNSV